MNTKSMVVMWGGIAVMAWIAFHPPTRMHYETERTGYEKTLGLQPASVAVVSTDVALLLVQEGIVLLAACAGLMCVQNERRRAETPTRAIIDIEDEIHDLPPPMPVWEPANRSIFKAARRKRLK